MLIPCFPLSPGSTDCKRFREEVEKHLSALLNEPLAGPDGNEKRIQGLLAPTRWNHNGCLTTALLLSDALELSLGWYLGARPTAWLGKRNKILIVLPSVSVETIKIKALLEESMAKLSRV